MDSLPDVARSLLDVIDTYRTGSFSDYMIAYDAAVERLRAALVADADRVSVPSDDEFAASMTTCELRGPRLVGPHGGIRGNLPNPTDKDLEDPLFEAIWQSTKTWDVNAPEYYVGYCGMNGSHVMLILNAVRTALAAAEKEPRNGS